MCKLAVEETDHVMVDDWEARQAQPSRTLLVLHHFRQNLDPCIDVVLSWQK